MPTIELDEAEIAALPEMRRFHAVANLIAKHPKGRELLQEAVLVAAPEHAGPEARMRAEAEAREAERDRQFNERIAQLDKEKADRETAAQQQQLQREWAAGREKAKTAGYAGDSLENLEKFMQDRHIFDHEVAISHFERLNPPPPPTVTGGSRWNWFDTKTVESPDLKPLLEQRYDDFLAQAIPAALRDARAGR